MTDERRSTDDTRVPGDVSRERTDGAGAPVTADRGPLVADGGCRIDRMLGALGERRRRYVLYYLRDERYAELDDLAEQVAAWETGRSSAEIGPWLRRAVRAELHHTHLPKLEEVGIIGFDRRHDTVCLEEPCLLVEDLLDRCATIEVPGQPS